MHCVEDKSTPQARQANVVLERAISTGICVATPPGHKLRSHPLDPRRGQVSPYAMTAISSLPQCMIHWEVPRACYSPSLTIQSGRGTPTFKGGVRTSKSTWMPRHPCLPRFKFSDITSQGVWLSLSDTYGWDGA